MEISFAAREQICALIRFHQAPYFLIERNDPVRLAVEISQTVNCSHLALLAEADVRGRLCADQQRLLDNVAMFAIHCQELGLLNRPHAFESDHQRVLYFLDKRRHLNTPAYPSFRTQVVMMAGLPGTGKDDYIRKTLPDWPVVSLDDLRDEMDVSPDDNQGRIIQKARESARGFLRKSQPFVWNATNVSRQLRGVVLDILLSYQAHVRICYVEAPRKILTEQIRQRDRKIPERIMNRLIDRWEVPDITEAHEVVNHVRP
jgi:predicted kinase